MIEMDQASITASERSGTSSVCAFEHPSDAIRYPLDFELRVIFRREGEVSIRNDVAEAASRAGLTGSQVGTPTSAGIRWGKLSCMVSIPDKTRMDALYAEIAKIASVKAAI